MEKEKNPFVNLPKLESERLILRRITYGDRMDIYTYAHLPEVTHFLKWEPHTSEYETLEFINLIMEQYNKHQPSPWAIELKEEHKVIGTIGYQRWDRENRCGEVGYALSPMYWNRGIMTEALKMAIKFGFEELDLNRFEAKCEPENIGSSRVMEKAGLTYEGTIREELLIKGIFRNYRHYSVLKSEYNHSG